jgi:hypothetical protein
MLSSAQRDCRAGRGVGDARNNHQNNMAFAIPVVFVASDLLLAAAAAVAGTAAGLLAYKQMTKDDSDRFAKSSLKSQSSHDGCPPHKWFTGKDINYLAKELGLTAKQVGERIHKLKKQLENNPDVIICVKCGDVASPKSFDIIGNLKD